jgi:transposase
MFNVCKLFLFTTEGLAELKIDAMDAVRSQEICTQPKVVKYTLLDNDRKPLKSLTWEIRRNPQCWSIKQTNAMHWLQHLTLKSAWAWRPKMALRAVYSKTTFDNSVLQAKADLLGWISRARHSRLDPVKKLATTLKQRIDGVVRGMLDNRSNAYVAAMNGLLQQAKRAARGFQNRIAFNRYRVFAYVQAQAFSIQPIATGLTSSRRANPQMPMMPSSTVNDHRLKARAS